MTRIFCVFDKYEIAGQASSMSESPSSKRDAFVRLANQRVTKAVKQIELVGNLSNKYRYEFSDKDARDIFAELEAALKRARIKFELSNMSGTGFRIKK